MSLQLLASSQMGSCHLQSKLVKKLEFQLYCFLQYQHVALWDLSNFGRSKKKVLQIVNKNDVDYYMIKLNQINVDKSHLTKEYLDTVVDWIPGMNNKNIRIRDLPSFERTTNPDDLMFNLTMEATDQASKASFIVIHTFQALEIQVLDALSSMFSHQHVLPIGPL
ncbi:hypothetical protein ACOSQ4_009773 [Xanthoceras sorbifolium]